MNNVGVKAPSFDFTTVLRHPSSSPLPTLSSHISTPPTLGSFIHSRTEGTPNGNGVDCYASHHLYVQFNAGRDPAL